MILKWLNMIEPIIWNLSLSQTSMIYKKYLRWSLFKLLALLKVGQSFEFQKSPCPHQLHHTYPSRKLIHHYHHHHHEYIYIYMLYIIIYNTSELVQVIHPKFRKTNPLRFSNSPERHHPAAIDECCRTSKSSTFTKTLSIPRLWSCCHNRSGRGTKKKLWRENIPCLFVMFFSFDFLV